MSSRAKASVFTQQATRGLVLLGAYALICALCRYVAYELRFDFMVPPEHQAGRLSSIAINLPMKLGFLFLFGQFSTMMSYFSLPDLIRVAGAVGTVVVIVRSGTRAPSGSRPARRPSRRRAGRARCT